MQLKIKTADESLKVLLIKLGKQGYKWTEVRPINKGRYYIVKGEPSIMVLFKKEFFFKFGEMFKKKGERGIGDSINVSDLKIAAQHDAKTIFILTPNGKIYYIPFNEFLNETNETRWVNKEGKEVRSISIHKYKTFHSKPEQTKR